MIGTRLLAISSLCYINSARDSISNQCSDYMRGLSLCLELNYCPHLSQLLDLTVCNVFICVIRLFVVSHCCPHSSHLMVFEVCIGYAWLLFL